MTNVTLLRRAALRRVLTVAGLASVAAGLMLIPATRGAAAADHAALGLGVTVRGPRLFNGNATHPRLLSQRSSVTVSQSSSLVNQFVKVSWAHFTPTSQPQYDPAQSLYSVMVAECRGNHPTSWNQCYGAGQGGVPGASGPVGPYNAVYEVTARNGTGFMNINVETALENSFLGCDQHHPCSLIVVPGQGGNDLNFGTNTRFACNDHSQDPPGALTEGSAAPDWTFNPSFGYCSWKDRIVIPLHFSAAVTGCPQRASAFTAAGSPMMARAMLQWLSGLCAGSNALPIAYNPELAEPQAMLEASSGVVDVALTTRPGSADRAAGVSLPASRHYLYAPVAVSAVSIAFWIDDHKTGAPFQRLYLDQRLVAKLLTTSYDFGGAGCVPGQRKPPPPGCDKGVKHSNPFDLFTDQEFLKLNPWMTASSTSADNVYQIPTVQSGHTDMTWTVTRWIGASRAAATFLRGRPDPWGMRVNSYYRGLRYPTDAFLSQDPYIVYANKYSPVYPLSRVAYYQGLNWEPGVAAEKNPQTGTYPADSPEIPGQRALVAILDQADSSALQFPVAALRNAAGHYVGPTDAGMAAAVAHMTSNGSGTRQANLARADPRAYPLTMVIYAMVPTAGTTHAKAAAIARFLNFAAGAGQTRGVQPGQLPAGYLPLPASLRAQTRTIAARVASQSGPSPSASPSASSTPAASLTGTPSASATPQSTVSLPKVTPSSQPITTVTVANPQQASGTRLVLPVLLILGGLAAVGGGAALAGSASTSVAARLRGMSRGAIARGRWARSHLGRRK